MILAKNILFFTRIFNFLALAHSVLYNKSDSYIV